MAKIKRKVEMTPKEFLKHLLEQEETEVELDGYTFNYNEEHYSFDPEIIANEVISYNPHSCTFTVEIEEEITKETEIPKLVSINRNNLNEVNINFNCSIGQFLDRSDYNYYILNDDGTMTLIWKDGAMVDDREK
ncbi:MULTISPECIES: hypothetical protein [Bacteria]|jgi:hypothetical protein|uniref:hypothetical protein n=1 Tax=Bacteria TaxID=2 RepID=UPI0010685CC6|nr:MULTISPECIES: hypothetical protein [Bacteria]MDU0853306.1 hypothetical protein [Veillonella sp.]MDU2135608.1 hypothetical protein [Enterococcus faecalis]MDU3236054.1 hypothetical protein [Enterococcus faecium]MDU7696179.1 hypothetical protein [Staphylococcus sp.]MDU7817120.1 hypothetical protein [Bacillota bacterium]